MAVLCCLSLASTMFTELPSISLRLRYNNCFRRRSHQFLLYLHEFIWASCWFVASKLWIQVCTSSSSSHYLHSTTVTNRCSLIKSKSKMDSSVISTTNIVTLIVSWLRPITTSSTETCCPDAICSTKCFNFICRIYSWSIISDLISNGVATASMVVRHA